MADHKKNAKFKVIALCVPASLYNEARAVVAEAANEVRDLNDLIIESLREHLENIREAELDAKFAEMKWDRRYQEYAVRVASEFEHSGSHSQNFVICWCW